MTTASPRDRQSRAPKTNMELTTPTKLRVSDARPVLPQGFKAAGLHCGVRAKKNKLDLGLIVADRAYPASALFTTNQLLGAHVIIGRESLAGSGGKVRALLVNSGNANCSTGEEGLADNRKIQRALAELLGCPPEQVLFMSTGVIGARLPVERLLDALPTLHTNANERGLGDFAQAIMTTDLVPKVRTLAVEDKNGPPFRVTGVAKGSGMIHPNMATMLGFVLTDGPADDHPKEMLARIADRSFHRLTVDGDTSPNDTFLLWSSQHAEASTHPHVPATPSVGGGSGHSTATPSVGGITGHTRASASVGQGPDPKAMGINSIPSVPRNDPGLSRAVAFSDPKTAGQFGGRPPGSPSNPGGVGATASSPSHGGIASARLDAAATAPRYRGVEPHTVPPSRQAPTRVPYGSTPSYGGSPSYGSGPSHASSPSYSAPSRSSFSAPSGGFHGGGGGGFRGGGHR